MLKSLLLAASIAAPAIAAPTSAGPPGGAIDPELSPPVRIEAASTWPLVWEEGTWVGQRGANGPTAIGGRYAAQWHRIEGRWLIRSELFVALHCSGDPCRWPVQSPEPDAGPSR